MEEIKQFLEKLVAKRRERLESFGDILLKLRKYALGVIPGLDLHQIDVPGFPFDFRTNKDITQCAKKFLFFRH